MANFNIDPGEDSGAIPTTPKGLVAVLTDAPVTVKARNNATTPASWLPLAKLRHDDVYVFVAPSDAVMIENGGAGVANVEVN